eukprot:TRINITY_DN72200_c0_g1_i1.p1 TRINITY_DN72200_c0_g1~~TRINITY_DN72200_c0_g1_i1.p1  ORF type:complete len:128 (-),score=7.17 TRINITY_DN72200_c0_g1_i1:9-392(-)
MDVFSIEMIVRIAKKRKTRRTRLSPHALSGAWRYRETYLCGMNRSTLIDQIRQKRSYLCVGLDTDITRIPAHLQSRPNAVFEFNKAIIDATKDHCVSYKINTAFYESQIGRAVQQECRDRSRMPSSA